MFKLKIKSISPLYGNIIMSRCDIIAIVNKAVCTFKCISIQFHRYLG